MTPASTNLRASAPQRENTCGTCGHYVRLIGAAHSHRCDITHSVVWPEKEACHAFYQGEKKTARVRVNPISRKGAEAQRGGVR